jgi:hypothetical protein
VHYVSRATVVDVMVVHVVAVRHAALFEDESEKTERERERERERKTERVSGGVLSFM